MATDNKDQLPPMATDNDNQIEATTGNRDEQTVTSSSPSPPPPPPSSAAINTAETSTAFFPCIEQPLRVTLHCNGYYLWGLRRGNVIARKRRSEKDEFRLEYTQEEGIVLIHNHKFGGALSVVVDKENGTKKLVCVKLEKEKEDDEQEAGEAAPSELQTEAVATATANTENDSNQQSSQNPATATAAAAVPSEKFSDEPEEEEDKPVANVDDITEEDRKWCFIKLSREGRRNQVVLKNLRTGENLAIDSSGKTIFATDDDMESPGINMTWDIECVTGELLFVSNPALGSRLRCDMAGLLTLTDAWKGWEVFRFMETNHHYVKISSWMHSQWLLCSTVEGSVTTCSHAESFLEDNPKGCSKWAVEKSPQGNGVVIRSMTFGRLLSVRDGNLCTFSEDDNNNEAMNVSERSNISSALEGKWWNSSVTNINNSMRNVGRRLSRASIKTDEQRDPISQKETIVWQLEAAHLQTYYFSSFSEGEKIKSIGPFPEVTTNLRKTDKIQLKREGGVARLYNTEKKQYIACSTNGNIVFVSDPADPNTEWIMDKPSYQDGGSIFRSKLHNLYLSYEDLGEDATANAQIDTREGHFSNPFNRSPEKSPILIGTELIGQREVWRLEPCMPRAVSSEKIATFALGTGIAVGTTVAMPFLLAGVGVVMGAVGAEVGIVANAIAVGLTGAEALASVGAIGATAYIVFRPAENSLTDDHNDDEEEAERAWSKRPFSNWRNW